MIQKLREICQKIKVREEMGKDLSRQPAPPDFPSTLRDLRVGDIRAAELLEFVHNQLANILVTGQLGVLACAGCRWAGTHDLCAGPMLEDGIRLDRQVGRDTEGEQMHIAGGEAGDETRR